MDTVESRDGTRIAFRRSGKGPPLVLVHGTTSDHTRWSTILPGLEERFTVHAMDRRGRGGSGDGPTYSIHREFEDVAAVVDLVGQPVFLLGHSYGAVCALEAALLTPNVRKLILYEPPIPTGRQFEPPGTLERLEALLAAGDRAGVVTTFFREVARLPPEQIALFRSLPNWPAREAAAHTIPRELGFHGHYRFEPARFGALRAPTLLLVGGESPPPFVEATEVVRRALPDGRVVVMPGQHHAAMNTAPELFLREVLAFLED